MCGFMQSFWVYTVQNDTHAANLTGTADVIRDDPENIAEAIGSGVGQTVSMTANIGTTETTVTTAAATGTPTNAANVVVITAFCNFYKITNNGTVTMRIKENTTTLGTWSSTSLNNGTYAAKMLTAVLTDVSLAAHTYHVTIQYSTDGGRWRDADISVEVIALQDTHAAGLTGNSGTCEI